MQLKDLEVFQDMPFLFAVKDEEGKQLWGNKKCLEVAQLTLEEFVGKTDNELIWASGADTFRANDRKVLESGQPLLVQESATFADGTKITASSAKFTAEIDGQKCLLVVAIPLD